MNILFRSPSKNNGTPVKSQMLDLSIMTPDSEKNETRVVSIMMFTHTHML